MENNYINNSAKEGGALSYINCKPNIANNSFQNNSALYGNDISSFPVKVKLYKGNSSDPIYFLENLRPSKDEYLFENLYIEYIDSENQIFKRNFTEGYYFSNIKLIYFYQIKQFEAGCS